MVRYIIRRLIGMVVILFVISVITFGMFYLIPANPALNSCGKGCNPQTLAAVEAKLGLDKPVFPIGIIHPELHNPADTQYGHFLAGLVKGRDYVGGGSSQHCNVPCFGYSFVNAQPVTKTLLNRLPVTASIAVGAAALWLVFGVSAGILSALKKGTIWDRTAMGLALAGVSLPVYFTGLVSLTIFCFKLHWLDTPTYHNLKDGFGPWAYNLILPWFTLAFLFAALYARLTRANMLETMGEDYIRTARAKGLSEGKVIGKHGLRAALSPIVTIFGLDLGALLGGAILTESIYGLPGLGQLALVAITKEDQPTILGVTVFAAFFIVFANLVVDVLYAFIDPKVSYA